jgi:hypothetical protein
MKITSPIVLRTIQTAFLFWALLQSQAAHAQAFQEDFSDGNVFVSSNPSRRWDVEGFTNGRTRFGYIPTIQTENGVTFARLPLETYNFSDTSKVKGTEITSVAGFGHSTSSSTHNSNNGWEFEARLRVPGAPGGNNAGLVFAFWTYKNHGGSSYAADETGYELLGNWPTNTFNLANFQRHQERQHTGAVAQWVLSRTHTHSPVSKTA